MNPEVREKYKDLVGQIFFKTNDRALDSQDLGVMNAALDYWRSYHANFYRNTRILFKFVGNADHRGSAAYNAQLAMERAGAVQRFFDQAFEGYPYYASSAVSLGETKAQTGDTAGSRRVDIFSSFILPVDQSVSFENTVLLGTYRGERSRKFKIRVFGGGGLSLGPIGANILSIEIVDPRTERSAMYRLTSLSAGANIGLNRPSDFAEVDTKDFVTVDDFEGNGGIVSASAGVAGGQLLRFDGPVERGVTEKSIVVPLSGWDLNLGFTTDFLGYWHRIGD